MLKIYGNNFTVFEDLITELKKTYLSLMLLYNAKAENYYEKYNSELLSIELDKITDIQMLSDYFDKLLKCFREGKEMSLDVETSATLTAVKGI